MMTSSRILKFGLACIFPIHIMASTIPEYVITDVEWPGLILTNEAAFTVNGLYWHIAQEWESSDQIKLSHNDLPTFPPSIVIQEGRPIMAPIFTVENLNQGTSVHAYLTTSPESSLLTLQAINPSLGQIILSDASIWAIRELDQRFFQMWEIGDVILIAENSNPDKNTFDAIIYNTTHSSTVHAIEQ